VATLVTDSTADGVDPFEVDVASADVAALEDRLGNARWPDQLPDAGWAYGTDREYLRSLCAYWREEYDWGSFEARCNRFAQFTTTIDGQRIHFYHVRSPSPAARPLLLPHGWPGSVAEFLDVLGPLTEPSAHGGSPDDAFTVVAPSLPGYGFSGPTREQGYGIRRVATTLATLMDRLGYDRYFVQGGDWGSLVAAILAARYPERVVAIHTNMLLVKPSTLEDPVGMLDEAGLAEYRRTKEFQDHESGYRAVQSTTPQSLAYGLADSPVGLAGWIIEKFRAWSDGDDLDASFGRDRLLDNLSVYWLTNTINSSMRLYYETDFGAAIPDTVDVPTGFARYPGEVQRIPRQWAEAVYDIVHWTEMPAGGHFAAMEVPDLFVEDVRDYFGRFR
jgi:microsomal epoxide hydrolase